MRTQHLREKSIMIMNKMKNIYNTNYKKNAYCTFLPFVTDHVCSDHARSCQIGSRHLPPNIVNAKQK